VIGGNNVGTVITGDHVQVTVVKPTAPPDPRPRERIGLLPQPQADPREPVFSDWARIGRAVASKKPVVITGPPGAGKTAVLRGAAARLHAEDTPVVFLDAAGQDVGDVLQQVFQACHHSTAYRPEPAELRSLMRDMRIRLVIDHFACPSHLWQFFLSCVPDAAVVAAMPERDVPRGPDLIALEGLDRESARRLLGRCLGRALDAADLPAADALWQATGRRPGLLMAVAERATAGVLPSAADLPGLLFDGLDEQEQEVIKVLTLGWAAPIDPRLLPRLLHASKDSAKALDLLTALKLITVSERGYRLAGGLAGLVPTHMREGFLDAVRVCDSLRAWALAPNTPPALIADHAPLISAAIDLAVGSDHPEAAVRLARAVAPPLALSLRTGAWADVLDHGLPAAREARDEPAQAYLAHEAGATRLVTGEPGAAAGLFVGAARIWDNCGNTTLADIARTHLARSTPPRTPIPPLNPQPANSLPRKYAQWAHWAPLLLGATGFLLSAVLFPPGILVGALAFLCLWLPPFLIRRSAGKASPLVRHHATQSLNSIVTSYLTLIAGGLLIWLGTALPAPLRAATISVITVAVICMVGQVITGIIYAFIGAIRAGAGVHRPFPVWTAFPIFHDSKGR
jgi:hypothetical protein